MQIILDNNADDVFIRRRGLFFVAPRSFIASGSDRRGVYGTTLDFVIGVDYSSSATSIDDVTGIDGAAVVLSGEYTNFSIIARPRAVNTTNNVQTFQVDLPIILFRFHQISFLAAAVDGL